MQLTFVIIAFAALLWFNGAQPLELLGLSRGWTLVLVAVQFPLLWGGTWWRVRESIRCLQGVPPVQAESTPWRRCRAILGGLQPGTLGHAGALTFLIGHLILTAWPNVARHVAGGADRYGLDDAVVIAPYLLAIVGIWWLQYPLDHALRGRGEVPEPDRSWSRGQFVLFNVRLQLLTVAAPMGLIVIASDALDRHRGALREWTGLWWTADCLLGVTVGVIFLLAPVLMRYIWSTERLADGPLRDRLEDVAERMSLKYREILVWRSRGMMVNAAVMGIVPQLRFVLLSDGLLEAMSPRQIEAVFGHEAGHVKFWHIPLFIVFATLTMMIAGGGMLLLQRQGLSMQNSQLVVGGVMVVVWGVAFGWLSHQFEHQADWSGASSIDVGDGTHGSSISRDAADEFASALRRVADLNGIHPEERGWRHPSIEHRIVFLRALSTDPEFGRRFNRHLCRAQVILVVATAISLGVAAWIYWDQLFTVVTQMR